jgi:hypothetical protein
MATQEEIDQKQSEYNDAIDLVEQLRQSINNGIAAGFTSELIERAEDALLRAEETAALLNIELDSLVASGPVNDPPNPQVPTPEDFPLPNNIDTTVDVNLVQPTTELPTVTTTVTISPAPETDDPFVRPLEPPIFERTLEISFAPVDEPEPFVPPQFERIIEISPATVDEPEPFVPPEVDRILTIAPAPPVEPEPFIPPQFERTLTISPAPPIEDPTVDRIEPPVITTTLTITPVSEPSPVTEDPGVDQLEPPIIPDIPITPITEPTSPIQDPNVDRIEPPVITTTVTIVPDTGAEPEPFITPQFERTLEISPAPVDEPEPFITPQFERTLTISPAPVDEPTLVAPITGFEQDGPGVPTLAPAPVEEPEGISGLTQQSQLPASFSQDDIALGGTGNFEATQEADILRAAKNQADLEARYKQPAAADWRVRIQLAPEADYLYRAAIPGILAPLYETDGVIFPYTPTIETQYVANYEKYDLIHSNYRGYFYRNSAVNEISVRGVFTAQDTQEAQYLLAVIHFFRSVTKMFYGAGGGGADPLRGAPPPLVYISGLGEYQFNEHPCLVSNFAYTLPNDVDYIRATAPNNYGTSLLNRRPRTGAAPITVSNPSETRLNAAGLSAGAVSPATQPSTIAQNVNNLTQATYVPTRIEIQVSLLPINTRSQISTEFSLEKFANGQLLKGGFW